MQNSGVDVLCCGSCPKKADLKWNPQKVLASCEAFLDTFPFAGAERDMDNPRHMTRKWWTYVEIVLVFCMWNIVELSFCSAVKRPHQWVKTWNIGQWWGRGLHGLHGQGLGLVEALRIVLATFRLPGEVAVGPTHGPTHGPSPIQQANAGYKIYRLL